VAIGRVGEGDVIASGSDDGTVRVWDPRNGRPIGDPLAGTSIVEAVALGRVGERDLIVSGSIDHMVRVWDALSGQPMGDPLTGHTGPIYAVAIGRVGERDVIVSGSGDGTVRVWNATNLTCMNTVDLVGSVSAVSLGHDGQLVIAVGRALCLFVASTS
jgi:WD40 repeat protein